LQTVYVMQREYHKARAHAEQGLRLTENVHDPALLLLVHQTLAISLYPLGELLAARAHFEQGLTWHNPQQPSPASVSCLSHLTIVLWTLGYPDQALRRVQEALALARQLSLPFWVGFALLFTTNLHYRRREERAAQEQAEAVITLATEQGFPFWLGLATICRGGVLAAQGQGEVGLLQIHQGLNRLRAMGSMMNWSFSLAILVEAYGKVGQAEAGLNVLAEALEGVDKTGERFYEAELYRLKGELTLQQFNVQGSKFQRIDPRSLMPDPQAEAEACFHKAIEIARRQQAKLLELRATVSLARLWQQQGKHHEASHTLPEIYSWFTEGFDTKDLQEAKALLEELH